MSGDGDGLGRSALATSRAANLDAHGWCATRRWPCRVRFLKWAFKYRVLKLGSNEVYSGKCMYLVSLFRRVWRSRLLFLLRNASTSRWAERTHQRLHKQDVLLITGDALPASPPQANHRSWGDFFVDMYVTGCRGVPLSRRAVGAAFPAFTTSLMALRSILLFNRLGVKDTEVRWCPGPGALRLLPPRAWRAS